MDSGPPDLAVFLVPGLDYLAKRLVSLTSSGPSTPRLRHYLCVFDLLLAAEAVTGHRVGTP